MEIKTAMVWEIGLTRCRAGPLWLDVRCPARDEGRHDLALRLALVQELVIVRIALRYACPFPHTHKE